MSIIRTSLDYSDRDFASLRLRLQGLIRSVCPGWTEFSVANFSNILIELFAFVGDTLHYYQDAQAMEGFWPTLLQRVSAIRHGKLINFRLRGAGAATAVETFSLPFAAPDKVLIPVGTRLSTADQNDPVKFRTITYAEITPGTRAVNVDIEQAELITGEVFQSTDEPNQEIMLTRAPYLDGSATISASNGPYTEVDSLLGAKPTDRYYVTAIDENDRVHIKFGNGVAGAIPTSVITASYKIGGGVAGNVEANKIIYLDSQVYYANGQAAPVAVTNESAASGGQERMSVQEAQLEGPSSLKLLSRCVSRDDFETAAKLIPGVARAMMITSNEYYGVPENTGRLYIVAQGTKLASGRIAPAAPSSALLTSIKNGILADTPPTLTFSFDTYAVVFKDVTITASVYLVRDADPTTVGAAIRTALQDYFAVLLATGAPNTVIDFGANLAMLDASFQSQTGSLAASEQPLGEITWSDIFNVVRDVSGVRKVDEGPTGFLINGARCSLQLSPIEFPRYIGATIINLSSQTGEAI